MTKPNPMRLELNAVEGKDVSQIATDLALSGSANNVITAISFATARFDDMNLMQGIETVQRLQKEVRDGNLSAMENMLTAQAVALDAIFNSLAQRASLNVGEHLAACESYLRLALKAQAQCAKTLETLATIKNPPSVSFVKQANIGNQVQVNNGNDYASTRPKGADSATKPREIHHDKSMDARTTATASRTYPEVEAVGAVNRPNKRGRKSQ